MNMRKRLAGYSFLFFALAMMGGFFFPHIANASHATLCDGFSRLNRAGCHGYFKGTDYYSTYGIQGQNIIDCTKWPSSCTGGESINNAIPSSIDTAAEFTNWVHGYLFNTGGTGYNYNKAGAAFIVDAMLGRWGTDYGTTAAGISYAQAHYNEWAAAVDGYATMGWITWNTATTLPAGTINSLHACWPSVSNCTVGNISTYDSQDFAFFRNPDSEASHILTFHNPNGTTFEIRRECGNLLGSISPLQLPNFNLTPTVGATVNGVASTTAEPGDTVNFTYTVNNSGSMSSTSTACNTYANTYAGFHTAASPAVPGGPAGPNPGCPRNFAPGGTTVATETFVVASGNQSICRSLFVDPSTYNGGQKGSETCINVANKPYLKVYGGDIAAGGGLASSAGSCTNNNNAAVTSWNRRASAGYAGAGAQYAVYALAAITDFASALGNAGGAATPVGLSFANTSTNAANGAFGGTFGTATCIPDYYGRKPASTNALPANVSAMTTGAYAATGTTTLSGGNVNPGDKISVYINGDLFINSDITYAGSWNVGNMPLFELVVKGNIYVSSAVHRLDGVYIAQTNGVSGGTIYTCATGTTPPTLTNGAFFNTCNSKLTINGAFVANSVEFLRTYGSLNNAIAGETSDANGNGNGSGEVFNFNPTLWMVQPSDTSGAVDNYDAISSLPPVL